MVAKPPGGRPGMVGGEPALGFVTALSCLATALCRDAAPPAHARLVCFVCCMMPLLFSYLLFAPGNPTASYFALRQQVALIPYIPRTLACCKASQFRLRSDATYAAIDRFLWCHPRKQNGHTRHLVATKVGAVVFATSERNDAACGRGLLTIATASAWSAGRRRSARLGCQTLTASARPTEPVAAACTAWDAAAAGDARASEPARRDGPYHPPTHHCCRHRSPRPAPRPKTHRHH